MTLISRRSFIAASSSAGLALTTNLVAAQKSEPPGRRLFHEYFSVHIPDRHVTPREAAELEAAEGIISRSVSQYLDDVAAVIGTETLEDRLADCANSNPICRGSVPLAYVAEPQHSHNILAGIPYTGALLGRFPMLNSIAPHEVGRLIFGKFNDALTEPVANLLLQRNFRPQRGDAMPPAPGPEPIPLQPNEAVLLAVLDLWEEGVAIVDARSLSDLFSWTAPLSDLGLY